MNAWSAGDYAKESAIEFAVSNADNEPNNRRITAMTPDERWEAHRKARSRVTRAYLSFWLIMGALGIAGIIIFGLLLITN